MIAFIVLPSSQAHAQEIRVEGNNSTVIGTGDPASSTAGTDFGSVGVGNDPNLQIFLVNDGVAPLTIGTPTISGTNAGDFSIIQQPASPIGVGAQTDIVVRFAPSALGLRTAQLSFTTNDPSVNSFVINLQGTGSAIPGSFTITGGGTQATPINIAFQPLEVTLLDTDSNPIVGASVTFNGNTDDLFPRALFSNGDSIITIQTNGSGVASLPATANGQFGSHNVSATTPGDNISQVNFSLTNLLPDTTPPRITSITRQSPFTQVTSADTLTWRVTFDESVQNVNGGLGGDFVVSGVGGATVAVNTINASTYDVTVSGGGLPTLNDTVTLSIPGSHNITNLSNLALTDTSPTGLNNNDFIVSNTGVPASIVATSGGGQSTQISSTFAAPLVATVRDANGNLVPGAIVTFEAIPVNGASATLLLVNTVGATTGIISVLTDAQGVARVSATANDTAGAYTVTASVGGINVDFGLTNLDSVDNEPPTLVSIDGQQGNPTSNDSLLFAVTFSEPVNTPAASDFSVTGTTATVTGISSVGSTGGVFNVSISGGDLANLNGDVTLSLDGGANITDTAGNMLVSLAPTGLDDSTITVINVGTLTATSGSPQNTLVNTPFTNDLVATVLDAGGSPVQGATVTFTPPPSGASATLSATSALTDVNGEARVTATANGVTGLYDVIASSAGLTDVSFSLLNNVGPAAQIVILSGNPQSAPLNEQFAAPLVVQVQDANGNPVNGALVETQTTPNANGATAVLNNGGLPVNTGTDGTVSLTATANGIAGSYTVTMTAFNTGGSSVVFNLTNSEGPTVEETQAVIAKFLLNRANNIVSNQPDITSFLPGSGGSSAGSAGSISLEADENQLAYAFATSRSQLHETSAQKLIDDTFAAVDENEIGKQGTWDAWVRVNGNHSKAGTAESSLVVGQAGVHYFLSQDFLFGLSGQIDFADETDNSANSSVNGFGWLIAPYLAAQLPNQDVFFELRTGYGQSNNRVSPDGTFEDEFNTKRFLISGKVSGLIELDTFYIKPEARLSYFEETQESYIDSINQFIPGQTVSLGEFRFGPELGKNIVFDNGTSLDLAIGLSGVLNFGVGNSLASQGSPLGDESFRARLNGGLKFATQSGIAVDLGGYYDGIGINDFESYGGSFEVKIPFN